VEAMAESFLALGHMCRSETLKILPSREANAFYIFSNVQASIW